MNSLPCNHQRGVVLVVSLIMLLLVTLMVVSGFNLTQTNLQVVYNLESRAMAKHAAERALEEVINSGSSSVSYDYNADGVNDVAVAVVCASIRSVTIEDKDVHGFITEAQTKASVATAANNTADADAWNNIVNRWRTCTGGLCTQGAIELSATAVDQLTGARMVVVQGITAVNAACP
jgi:Tfp pilus assembly protein PilX